MKLKIFNKTEDRMTDLQYVTQFEKTQLKTFFEMCCFLHKIIFKKYV